LELGLEEVEVSHFIRCFSVGWMTLSEAEIVRSLTNRREEFEKRALKSGGKLEKNIEKCKKH